MVFSLFAIKNSTNGKSYIGYTSQNPIECLKDYKRMVENGTFHSHRFQRDYKAQNGEGFTVVPIATNLTYEQVKMQKKAIMKIADTYNQRT